MWDVTLAYPPGWVVETGDIGPYLASPDGVIVLISSRPADLTLEQSAEIYREAVENAAGRVTDFVQDRMGARTAYWMHSATAAGTYAIDVLAQDGRHEVQMTWLSSDEPTGADFETFRQLLETVVIAP